jgi:hypothetical protein
MKKTKIKMDLFIAGLIGLSIGALICTSVMAVVAGALHYSCNH